MKYNQPDFQNDLVFLETYWERAKAIAEDVQANLPIIPRKDVPVEGCTYIRTINYSAVQNWSTSGMLGVSPSLNALAHKISTMVYKNRSDSVRRMVLKIASGRLRKFYRNPKNKTDSIGTGHFKWDYRTYTLTESEIERVREFFNIPQ